MVQKNPAVKASGISPKEYAEAVKEAVKNGGGSDKEARRAASKAHRSAS